MSPFDIVGQLSTSAADNWDADMERDYVPFMINRAFSYHQDTLGLAGFMNQYHTMDKQMQYDMYRLEIRPKRARFAKWGKAPKDLLIGDVMEAYQVNRSRAISILSLWDDSDIKKFKECTFKGGK